MSTCVDEASKIENGVDELASLMQSTKPVKLAVKKLVAAGDESLEHAVTIFLQRKWQWIGTGFQWIEARFGPFFLPISLLCVFLFVVVAWRWHHFWNSVWQHVWSMTLGRVWRTNTQAIKCSGFSCPAPSPGQPACPEHAKDNLAKKVDVKSQSQFRCCTLVMAVVGTAGLMVATLMVGRRIGSLALIGDGIHLSGDVATYAALLFAEVVSSRWQMEMETFSYGYGRLEVIFVFIALSGQYYAASLLVFSAIDRLFHPHELAEDSGVMIFSLGLASLVVNAGLGSWMHFNGVSCCHSNGEGGAAASAAKIHLMCDGVQNLIVIITGGIIWSAPALSMLEPFCTLIFVSILVYSTHGFWLMMLDILMVRVPRNIDCEEVYNDLNSIKGVDEVHCLHVWAIAPGKIAAIAHLCTEDSSDNEEALQEARTILQDRYGIKHSTVQVSDSDDIM